MRTFLRHNAGVLVVLGILAVGFVLVVGPGLGMPVVIPLAMLVAIAAVAAIVHRWTGGSGPDGLLSPLRVAGSVAVGVVVVALLAQAVPYGRAHSNPPVTAEPAWDSPRTRELTVRACYSCHSNEVDYPLYASVAPFSWAVQMHVDGGRSKVNYSEWNRGDNEGDDSAETVIEGEMPPGYYTAFGLNGDARLTETERAALVAGLEATLGTDGERDGEREGDRGDDDEDD